MQNTITTSHITDIPASEVLSRRARMWNKIGENFDAAIFFSSAALKYLTGGNLFVTERPMVCIIRSDLSATMLVPLLEEDYVLTQCKALDRVVCYPEYPDEKHPMLYLKDLLSDMGLLNAHVAVDSNGSAHFAGYRGPKLSELCPDMTVTAFPHLMDELKMIKSPFDILAIKECIRWQHLAAFLLREYTKPGLREIDICNKAIVESSRIMLMTLGPDFNVSSGHTYGCSTHVRYRGQIGEHSYYPHSTATNAVIHVGDGLISGSSADLLGYTCEMERTHFVGEPSKEQCKYYEHARAMQQLAFENIRAGRKCSDIDKEVRRYYEENGLMQHWRHHTGHSLGFSSHEGPFFDHHDDTVLQSGMVLSVEPGLYVKGLGGFRLSDTVLVTDDGVEILTYFPRELERIIIEVF